MRILAFESSAKAASVALVTDGVLTAEYYQNSGQTHSRTLLKLADDLLQNCDLSPKDVDAVAWANGPGSFTGVRIGAAAAKGFCWGGALPCAAVSTLESMALSLGPQPGIVCCCMDARREQVYNALFCWDRQRDQGSGIRDQGPNPVILSDQRESKDPEAGEQCSPLQGEPTRLCADRAISVEELAAELRQADGPITLVGDGAKLVYDTLRETVPRLILTPEHHRHQRASGVALAAWQKAIRDGNLPLARDAVPNYLRLSQAERERLAKTL